MRDNKINIRHYVTCNHLSDWPPSGLARDSVWDGWIYINCFVLKQVLRSMLSSVKPSFGMTTTAGTTTNTVKWQNKVKTNTKRRPGWACDRLAYCCHDDPGGSQSIKPPFLWNPWTMEGAVKTPVLHQFGMSMTAHFDRLWDTQGQWQRCI